MLKHEHTNITNNEYCCTIIENANMSFAESMSRDRPQNLTETHVPSSSFDYTEFWLADVHMACLRMASWTYKRNV